MLKFILRLLCLFVAQVSFMPLVAKPKSGVEPRSRIHLKVRKPGTLRFHCIPPLTSATKYNNHFLLSLLLIMMT